MAGFTDGARRFLVVSAKEGNGCGEFSGALTAVYEDKGGKPVLLSGPDLGYLDVAAIVDLDGDGTIELVGDPEDFSTVTALYRETATRIELPAIEQLCALFKCSVGDLLEVVPDNQKGTP